MLTSDRREFLKQSMALAPAAEAGTFARSARAADNRRCRRTAHLDCKEHHRHALTTRNRRKLRLTEGRWFRDVQPNLRLSFRRFSVLEKCESSKQGESHKTNTEPELSTRKRDNTKPECASSDDRTESETPHRSHLIQGQFLLATSPSKTSRQPWGSERSTDSDISNRHRSPDRFQKAVYIVRAVQSSLR